MAPKSMQQWMSTEMTRLYSKLERYKPACSGYNRIQPILLSKSVTQMLNNPLQTEDHIGTVITAVQPIETGLPTTAGQTLDLRRRSAKKKVLSRSESEWEEVYPAVRFCRSLSYEPEAATDIKSQGSTADGRKNFAYYRNCSTRITK